MKLRTVFSTILLSLALPAANARTIDPDKAAPPADQAKPATPATAAQGSGRETPPDAKAYQEANRTTDPAKKIEALEKFKKDFPDSTSITNANVNILSTMASKMSDQTIEALEKFKKDFPESTSITNANVNILSTMASKMSDQKIEALEKFKKDFP